MKYFDLISTNEDVLVYLQQADENFKALGYTEQGLTHAKQTASLVEKIMSELNFAEQDIDIGKSAGFLHDIGCCISYKDHAQTGAVLVNKILSKNSVPQKEILKIVNIIGAHEDIDYLSVSDIAAVVTIADKTDVRRERVIKTDFKLFDKHDRVHYAVVKNDLKVYPDNKKIVLELQIDDSICSVLEYFELFMLRVETCKKAINKLGLNFEFYINEVRYL
jgi:putative nucleotidyltransferase with HDIG domain